MTPNSQTVEPPDGPPREAATQLRRRMLDAAQRLVEQSHGLAVSLEGLSYDRVIKEAGVPRTSAYRVWPSKEAFYLELLYDLAGPSWQGTSVWDDRSIKLARDILAERLSELQTPDGREQLLRDVVRLAIQANFEGVVTSTQWRTLVALTATVLSPPHTEERRRVQAALQDSEQAFIRGIAAFLADAATVLGYRLRAHVESFETVAAVGASIVQGMCIRHGLTPDLVDRPLHVREAHGAQTWHLTALTYWSAVRNMIEPNPDYEYASALVDYLKRLAAKELAAAHPGDDRDDRADRPGTG